MIETIEKFVQRGGKIQIVRSSHSRRPPARMWKKWDTRNKNNAGIKVNKKIKGGQGSRGTKFSLRFERA